MVSNVTSTSFILEKDQREETILSFLPLVRHLVGKIAINIPSFLDSEDLVEVGIIGLIAAVDTYNPTKETSLKTYVYTKVKGAILDELRKVSFFSREFYQKLKRLKRTYEELQEKLQRTPSLDELAKEMDISQKVLGELLTALRSQVFLSIDQTFNSEKGNKAGNLLSLLTCPKCETPEEIAENEELKEKLAEAIQKLPDRERKVVILYYFEDLLLQEISKVLKVSPARISHLHSRALYRLNHALKKS